MPQPSKILVWDLPTRTFHWLLVLSFSVAWITHEDNRYLYAHTVAGYFFFGLLLFRIAWGVIGSHYARFRAFAYDWRSASGYLRALLSGQASRYLGHNPIGSWAIFLLLALGLLISISGLVVLGGEEGHGVLRGIVPYALGKAAKEVHEALAATMVLVIIIHIAGVIVESLIHRENLVQAMLTGYKIGKETGVAISRFRLLGISLLIIFSVAGLYAFKGYLTARPGAPFLPFVGPSLADDPVWRKACAECHLAFHPSLLPARSWQKMLDEQAKHFGEDLGLDVADTEHLHAFLAANSAEHRLSEPARKIADSTPSDVTPMRITDTAYWKRKHREISEDIWNRKSIGHRNRCEACHWDAQKGSFEDSAMRIPKD